MKRSDVTFVRIISPHFVTGFTIDSVKFPKVIAFMQTWSLNRMISYCNTHGWRLNALVHNKDWKELTTHPQAVYTLPRGVIKP